MAQKGKRKPNFSYEERLCIVDEFGKNRSILSSKHSNTVTNTRKNAIWMDMTKKVNALNPKTTRTVQLVI